MATFEFKINYFI